MNGRQVLIALIAINVAVFLLWTGLRDSDAGLDFMATNFTVSLAHVQSGRVWTLLTSAFSHVGTGHLIFNMFALWVFGQDTVEELGPWRFLHLYVAGGIVASVGHLVFQAITGSVNPALGASGAVMAISVMYAAMFPSRTLLVFGIVPAPAVVVVIGYTLLDVFGVVARSGDGVAHAAHLGGSLYGLLYWMSLRSRER